MVRMTNIVLSAVLLSADLLAGGFFVTLGNPVASRDPKAKDAVLVVRPGGCNNPENAKVTGTAEGIVDGQRKTITLDFVPLATPGTYAVMRQWPAEGKWVLRITARDQNRVTSVLVPIDGTALHRDSAKYFPREAPAEALDAMLRG